MSALIAYLFDRKGENRPEPPAILAMLRPSRDMAKTFTYAIMHLTVAVMVAYALTRDIRTALAIGIIEPACQTVAYYFHERAWAKNQAKKDALARDESSPG